MKRLRKLLKRLWADAPGALLLGAFAVLGFTVVLSMFITSGDPIAVLCVFIVYLGVLIVGVNLAAGVDLGRK